MLTLSRLLCHIQKVLSHIQYIDQARYLIKGAMVIKLLKTFVAVYVVALVLVQFCVVYSLSAVTNAQTIPMAPDQLSLSSTDAVTSISQTNIVSLSIIIDEANHFDQLAAWLRTISFRNFTFVVVEGTTNAYILENTTRLNILKEYGRIIPRLSYMQGYELSNRLYNVNFTLNEFKEALGYTPKGVMDFIPDTYTAKYLLSRGVEYYQGYSFDQYNIDYMTMRGGFQMPYYANGSNILCPNTPPGGMVVLPHSTWDWVASYNVTHNLQLHPMNILNYYNRSVSAAKNYFISLVDNTFSGSSPFGYVTIQFEWSWLYRDGSASVVSDWIQTLFSSRQSYNYWTFEDTITWFKANYDRTPTYEINFISPHNEERIDRKSTRLNS